MEFLAALWLPILVSAVLVFFASYLSWMLLPLHKKEFARMRDEGAFYDKLRAMGLEPGKYVFPHYECKQDLEGPAFKERWEAGPHGLLHIWDRRPNMARNLVLTFVFYVVVGIFVAYLLYRAFDGTPGAYLAVFQVSGTAAILAHAFGGIPNAIWFHKPATAFWADLLDGVIYGLLTAGAFAAFWHA